MLVITDLGAWDVDPLASLVEARRVKLGLTPAEDEAVVLLRELFPRARSLNTAAMAADRAPAGWLALAVAAKADASQYDALMAVARRPAALPGPIAAIALAGCNFHGNRGRPWSAPRGNLHLSCCLPVDLDLARSAAALPATAAVAVCDALAQCAPDLEPRLKWVNDVLLAGAKVAGVLAAAQTRGSRVLALTFGIGVNVAVAPEVAPTVFVPRVTCLHAHAAGRQVTVGGLTLALLAALGARVVQLAREGPDPVIAAYRQSCGDIGRRVGVWAEGLPDAADLAQLPPPLATGRVLALAGDLALVVDGAPEPLRNGRLAYLD